MILITGAGGMIGSHMVDYYSRSGDQVVGTYYTPTVDITEIDGRAIMLPCDVRDAGRLDAIVRKYKPGIVFHLAAQSYPALSWEKPWETMEINSGGTINLFEAIKRVRQIDSSYDPMVVVACSSAEYGMSLASLNAPATEDTPLLPLHPYGVSKVAQDLLAYQYYQNDGIRCIRARIFNTTGPRKRGDVCSDFVRRIVEAERDGASSIKIRVGNLETRRAIMDVRDTFTALLLLAERGTAGDVYNISSSKVYSIAEVIDVLSSVVGQTVIPIPDKSLFRPTDEAVITGDVSKLMHDTGWIQSVALEETLSSMLSYWRSK